MYSILVDDEENIRKLLRKYAEFAGYCVFEAEHGMDAVNKCRETVFGVEIKRSK